MPDHSVTRRCSSSPQHEYSESSFLSPTNRMQEQAKYLVRLILGSIIFRTCLGSDMARIDSGRNK